MIGSSESVDISELSALEHEKEIVKEEEDTMHVLKVMAKKRDSVMVPEGGMPHVQDNFIEQLTNKKQFNGL